METPESRSTESIKLTKECKKEDRTVSWPEFKGCLKTLFRSSLIGTAIGALPGLGITIASFLGYAAAKNASKHPEEFGKGSLEGVAAPEAANNAVLGANLIPLFSLGIPGNLSAALLLGAFMIHGVSPGPLMFQQQGRLIYGIYGALIISNLLNLLIGRFGLKFFAKVLLIPKRVIFPLVVFLCMVGVYLTENSLFAVGLMFIFAFLGYFMKKLDFSFISFIIGFVLGPILEMALRQTLIISKNNPMILFNHPISLTFLILTVISIWRLGFGSKRFLTGLSGGNKAT
jgi:putative tricarboxylic transport membrane protein